MFDATLVLRDIGAFCRLDELGLEVMGNPVPLRRSLLLRVALLATAMLVGAWATP